MKSTHLMPQRARLGDCGYDFYLPYDVDFKANEWVNIDTGVKLEQGDLQFSSFMMLVPRSSMGTKYGLKFRNTIGIVDSQYYDTIKACVCTEVDISLPKGTRFMQGIVVPFFTIAGEVKPSSRREGGIGSTGQ